MIHSKAIHVVKQLAKLFEQVLSESAMTYLLRLPCSADPLPFRNRRAKSALPDPVRKQLSQHCRRRKLHP